MNWARSTLGMGHAADSGPEREASLPKRGCRRWHRSRGANSTSSRPRIWRTSSGTRVGIPRACSSASSSRRVSVMFRSCGLSCTPEAGERLQAASHAS